MSNNEGDPQTTDYFGYERWSPTSCRRCGYERADCTCVGGFATPVNVDHGNAQRWCGLDLQKEPDVIRTLWDCAKEKDVEVSGMSWNGFNLIGDRKSVDELRRLMHEEERFKAYRRRIEDGVS